MRIVSVVGARPQFVKLKPMHDAIIARNHDHLVVHTGQHYDTDMSDAFFDGLSLPDPVLNLEVGSTSHAQQTALIMERLEHHLEALSPDWMLVYGDTNSTLAAALLAAKAHTPVAHVEAGLRSRNRAMPEEINRILTDHASDLLLAPTPAAMANLTQEGLAKRSHLVGDVMNDLILRATQRHETGSAKAAARNGDYVVATIHRASNTDNPIVLTDIVNALSRLEVPVVLVAHPRLRAAAAAAALDLDQGSLESVSPLPYLEMLDLMKGSLGVVTDSGGLQKEAFLLGVACTTLRAETEWTETLADDRNILDPRGNRLTELAARPVPPLVANPYGDGTAALRIVDLLETSFRQARAVS